MHFLSFTPVTACLDVTANVSFCWPWAMVLETHVT